MIVSPINAKHDKGGIALCMESKTERKNKTITPPSYKQHTFINIYTFTFVCVGIGEIHLHHIDKNIIISINRCDIKIINIYQS